MNTLVLWHNRSSWLDVHALDVKEYVAFPTGTTTALPIVGFCGGFVGVCHVSEKNCCFYLREEFVPVRCAWGIDLSRR